MRIFIGIELSCPVKEKLFELQQQIRPYVVKGHFTSLMNFHLTLQFIGETPHSDILRSIVSSVAGDSKPFDLSLDHLGQFLKKNKSILWAGPDSDQQLNELYEKLHQHFLHHHLEMEKRSYAPHVTFGRNIVLLDSFEQMRQELNWKAVPVTIDNITLFESTRIHDQLVYRPIARYQIGL
ncbi:RNA 2',3'-cyclic phosphodiesterase [Desemzia sp. FAM 23991]|uniref:RNA 2',3'-cyclic phosphodiesterase n=1 Tax=unclassified Desemzia TaxID=2685243 RepID=UPI0038877A0C